MTQGYTRPGARVTNNSNENGSYCCTITLVPTATRS